MSGGFSRYSVSAHREGRTNPAMTQKCFWIIANTIRDMGPSQVRQQSAYHFADALAKTNPRFKRDLFLRACGIDDGRGGYDGE